MINIIEPKVKIKHSGGTSELTFEHAHRLFKIDKKNFEIVNKDKYEVINGELIKKAPKKKKADNSN